MLGKVLAGIGGGIAILGGLYPFILGIDPPTNTACVTASNIYHYPPFNIDRNIASSYSQNVSGEVDICTLTEDQIRERSTYMATVVATFTKNQVNFLKCCKVLGRTPSYLNTYIEYAYQYFGKSIPIEHEKYCSARATT
jgi:hypothetical protein